MLSRSRKLSLIIAAAIGLLAVATVPYWYGDITPQPPSLTLQPDDGTVIARGQQVYLANCASCHGGKLEGQPNWRERNNLGMLPAPPHDASGHTWHHPDEMLFALTKYGVATVAKMPDYQSAMPAFEGRLSDADILAALSWIKSQWPDDIRAQHDAVNERAKKS